MGNQSHNLASDLCSTATAPLERFELPARGSEDRCSSAELQRLGCARAGGRARCGGLYRRHTRWPVFTGPAGRCPPAPEQHTPPCKDGCGCCSVTPLPPPAPLPSVPSAVSQAWHDRLVFTRAPHLWVDAGGGAGDAALSCTRLLVHDYLGQRIRSLDLAGRRRPRGVVAALRPNLRPARSRCVRVGDDVLAHASPATASRPISMSSIQAPAPGPLWGQHPCSRLYLGDNCVSSTHRVGWLWADAPSSPAASGYVFVVHTSRCVRRLVFSPCSD